MGILADENRARNEFFMYLRPWLGKSAVVTYMDGNNQTFLKVFGGMADGWIIGETTAGQPVMIAASTVKDVNFYDTEPVEPAENKPVPGTFMNPWGFSLTNANPTRFP